MMPIDVRYPKKTILLNKSDFIDRRNNCIIPLKPHHYRLDEIMPIDRFLQSNLGNVHYVLNEHIIQCIEQSSINLTEICRFENKHYLVIDIEHLHKMGNRAQFIRLFTQNNTLISYPSVESASFRTILFEEYGPESFMSMGWNYIIWKNEVLVSDIVDAVYLKMKYDDIDIRTADW